MVNWWSFIKIWLENTLGLFVMVAENCFLEAKSSQEASMFHVWIGEGLRGLVRVGSLFVSIFNNYSGFSSKQQRVDLDPSLMTAMWRLLYLSRWALFLDKTSIYLIKSLFGVINVGVSIWLKCKWVLIHILILVIFLGLSFGAWSGKLDPRGQSMCAQDILNQPRSVQVVFVGKPVGFFSTTTMEI